LVNIQQAQASGVSAPPVPIQPDLLSHINLNSGDTYVGVGLLGNLKKFNWPWILKQKAFADSRQTVEQSLRNSVAQVKSSGIDLDEVNKVTDAVKSMEGQVGAMAQGQEITPTQYVDGMRYLKEIKQSLQVLQQSDAAKYFSGSYQARGDNVAQLVQNMSGQGLRFAPAAPGDQTAYTALHQDMVAYVTRLQQLGGR
jgi:hypothetical protein